MMTQKKYTRPHNLVEVIRQGNIHGDMGAALREFLDEFYIESCQEVRVQMLAPEPPLTGVEHRDAYFAAVAEHLSRRYKLPIPQWTNEESRFLKIPYYPAGLESLKAICLVESPIAFRRRMIFVDRDPLSRPRRRN
jgi:hypothetical protein